MQPAVAIVGAGPTGLTLASLLGVYGVPTVIVERSSRSSEIQYPRAVGIDDDALRTFQTLDLVDEMLPDIIQNPRVKFIAADGRTLAEMLPKGKTFGWYPRNMFMQQLAERLLREGLDRYDSVQSLNETEAVGLTQRGDAAVLSLRDLSSEREWALHADYVVGADGAKSTIRGLVGQKLKGKTFKASWLILEVDNDPLDAPFSGFHCNPARPVYTGRLPHNHRRWGIMLHPDEHEEWVLSDHGLRTLLTPLVPSFDDLNIIRAHVYNHQSRIVDEMAVGRVALVGDAAHLMPPWAGQGLNSGLRDAANLAWKLAAANRGLVSEQILRSYHSERHKHAKQSITTSQMMGIFIFRNRALAAVRDALLLGLKRVPGLREYVYDMRFRKPQRYDSGVIVQQVGDRGPSVGAMFIQPEVEQAGRTLRLDEALGPWFAVVSHKWDARSGLSREALRFWESLGTRFVRIEDSRPGSVEGAKPGDYVEDLHGVLGPWFERNRAAVAVIRPDRCVAAVATQKDFERVTGQFEATLRSYR